MTRNAKRIKTRLSHWYDLAEARHIASGKNWYREAHDFARELAHMHGVGFHRTVGVIAALSPSVFWELNKRQAESLIGAYADGADLTSVTVSTYGKQADKARRILTDAVSCADVTDILGVRAFKTLAFFSNLYSYPDSLCVTVDQHIIDAAGYGRFWVQSAIWCYELLAEAICLLAKEVNLRPYEVQAIIWITYKDAVGRKMMEEDLPF